MRRSTLLALGLATLELKLDAFVRVLERRYRPDQPRVPAGNPDGGQWTRTGDTEGSSRARTAFSAPKIGEHIGFDSGSWIKLCFYQDMFGRDFTLEQEVTEACPLVLVVPPYYGPLS